MHKISLTVLVMLSVCQAFGQRIDEPFYGPYDLTTLREKLTAKELHIRTKTARTLGKASDIDAKIRVDLLVNALRQECDNPMSLDIPEGSYATVTEIIKRQYIFAITDIGSEAIPALKQSLQTATGEFKGRLAIALSELGDEATYATLIDTLKYAKDGYLRASAARALGKLGNKDAIPWLVEALKDEFWVISKVCAIAPDPEFNKYYPVRDQAWGALVNLGVKGKREGYRFILEQPIPQTNLRLRNGDTIVTTKLAVNGEITTVDILHTKQGVTLVPVRPICRQINVRVTWNHSAKSVTIDVPRNPITLRIGQKIAIVNGKEIKLGSAPRIVNDYTLVSLESLAKALSAAALWDRKAQFICLNITLAPK